MATITERLKSAWQAYRNPVSLAHSDNWPIFASEEKAAPFVVWPDYRMDTPQWRMIDLAAYIEEGYNSNALIYSAIRYKAFAAGQPKMIAYTGDEEEPEKLPRDHWLSQIAMRPNPSQSWREYQMYQEIMLNISGDAFGYVERERGGRPKSVYPLNPMRVRILPRRESGRGVIGFVYMPEGASVNDYLPLLPQDVIHTKLPNPFDPFEGDGYGMSPISPGARSSDVDNMVTKFLQMFFEKGALPAGILSYDRALDNNTVAEIKRRWRDTYGGYEKWVDVGVLDQSGEYQRIGQNFDEMSFDSLDQRNEARIIMPFGVPPILIGSRIGLERSTYSNYEEARKAFWQDTMLSELMLFQDDYQYHLSFDGCWLAYDLNTVPALADDENAKAALVGDAFLRGSVSANEYRATLGLDPIDDDYFVFDISKVRVPVNSAPVQVETDTGAEADTREDVKKKSLTLTEEQKTAHWKAFDKIAATWESKFADAAAEALDYDMRKILAILTEKKKEAQRTKATIEWSGFLERIREYLGSESRMENWGEKFLPLIVGVVEDQGKRWATQLGISFSLQPLYARDWFNSYTLTFAKPINDTTLTEIATILNQAQQDGWSVPTMQSRLEQLFTQYINGGALGDDFDWYAERLPPHRTEMIARTETIRASNAGTTQLFTDWGVQKREWLSTRDGRTRSRTKGDKYEHLTAWPDGPDGEVKPMNEAFTGTGQPLMYPGDPIGSAANTINCRCTIIPVVPESLYNV